MSIIKEQIRYIPAFGTGYTTNIRFGITAEDGFLGLQQEIDNLTQNTSDDLINPSLDVEERRIKYIPNIGPLSLQFNFHWGSGNSWMNTFLVAGFTAGNLYSTSQNVLNSFFILDYYDTWDINTQTKIFTSYLTKITSAASVIPTYIVGGTDPNQLYWWYLPVWYLNAFTGTTATGYTKFSFYNASTGKVQVFYNSDNESLTNAQKMYFKTEINLLNKTWKIPTPSSHLNVVIAKELWNSPAYTNKVDATVVNYGNETQNYPSGNTFNYLTGKYNNI